MSVPCDLCDLIVEFDNYETHQESHKCDDCGGYYNLDEHKCSSNYNHDIINQFRDLITSIIEEEKQKVDSLEKFMENNKEMVEEMKKEGFYPETDFTFENNNLVPLTEKCNDFILNFEKEKADDKEEKEKDEKTKLENIELENLNFIQKCSKSECNICDEQTEKKYVCTECKYAQEMCEDCLENLIRNRYHMSGGDTYISCMSCKTKLEF